MEEWLEAQLDDEAVLIDGLPFVDLPDNHREDAEVLVSYLMGME